MDGLIDHKTTVRTIQLISVPSAFFVAGYCLSLSQNVLPAIYDHPPQFSAPSLKQIFSNATSVVPTITVASTAAFSYLAYTLPDRRREWTRAAIAMAITVPWASLVMGPDIRRLNEIASDKAKMLKSEQNLEHRQLLVRWMKQNYVTVVLQLASAAFGLQAMSKP